MNTIAVVSKALNLLYYVIYLSNDDLLLKIFDSIGEDVTDKKKKILKIKNTMFSFLEKFSCLFADNTYDLEECQLFNKKDKNYIFIFNLKRKLLFKGFNCLSFLWIRFPDIIPTDNSKLLLKKVFSNLKNEEDKLTTIKTLTNIFNEIKTMIAISQKFCKTMDVNKSKKKMDIVEDKKRKRSKDKILRDKEDKKFSNNKEKKETYENFIILPHDPLTENIDLNFDYGLIHLFFENFINEISFFISKELNVYLRMCAISLIKLIIDQGNINIHSITPTIFSALFDYSKDIRNNTVFILEKSIKNSKEKFLSSLKDSLKAAYEFQRILFIENCYLNSFVKDFKVKLKNVEDFNNTRMYFRKSEIEKHVSLQNKEEQDYELLFSNTDENIFELFLYRSSKINKNGSFNFKFLEKIFENFRELKNLDQTIFKNENKKNINSVNIENQYIKYESYQTSDVLNLIRDFEYFEFLANLLADYKFTKSSEIYFLVKNLFQEYDIDIQLFNSRFKEFLKENGISKVKNTIENKNKENENEKKKNKNELLQNDIVLIYLFENNQNHDNNINCKNISKQNNNFKFDLKLLSAILILTLKTALIQFLLAKYDFLEKNERIIINQTKRVNNFNENINCNLEDNYTFEDINDQFPIISISKDLRNFKFYEFYSCFAKFYKNITQLITFNSYNNHHGKNKPIYTESELKKRLMGIIDIVKNLKFFYKMKRIEIKNVIGKFRKNSIKNTEENNSQFLFDSFFKNVKIEVKCSDINSDDYQIKNNDVKNINNTDNKRNNKELNIAIKEENKLGKRKSDNKNKNELILKEIKFNSSSILNNINDFEDVNDKSIRNSENLKDEIIEERRKNKIKKKNNRNKRVSLVENHAKDDINDIDINFRNGKKKKK